jgi:Tol biopolymer transport system component
LERAPEARRAFLDEACGDDHKLRQQVEVLVSKDGHAGSLLEKPVLTDITAMLVAHGSLVGRKLGPYEIVSPLGAGGMGEVYRAHDSKLGRDVAIKTLPPEFARDPERSARFRREARALASLNHPNIAAIYGLEEFADVDCLVLELVEGEALRGPLPIATALDRAGQVAEALEAAHAKGIIHRDLKPANVKVTPQGRVKVLDFGLARAVWGARDKPDLCQVATVTGAGSMAGHIVGTPGYMSPEQARGSEVDQRTDVWAFGCLLYELLTGNHAFRCETVSDTIAAVPEGEPDWQALPAKTPAKIRALLRQCLQRDVGHRLKTIADARGTIERAQRGWSRWRLATVTTAAVVIVSVAVVVYLMARRNPRYVNGRPGGLRGEFSRVTSQAGVEWLPSLSPDGKWLVYAAERGAANRHIYLQSVNGQNPLDLTRDSSADDDQPVFSPDGELIAFRSSRDGGGIFVMGRTGEEARRVTRAGFHPSWSPDGTQLAFSTENIELYPQNPYGRSGELWTVTLNTGETRRLIDEDATLPSWSPHNRRIAFTRRVSNRAQGGVWTIPVKGGTATPVTRDLARDWNPVWSRDGRYLYFVSDRSGSMNLWRVPIDETSGQTLAEPEPITTPAPYLAHPSLSADGRRIAYSSVVITANIQRLTLDTSTAVKGDPAVVTAGSRLWSSPDPSPDGEWVAFYSLAQPEGQLHVSRPDGTALRQVTNDMAIYRLPRWSQWPPGAVEDEARQQRAPTTNRKRRSGIPYMVPGRFTDGNVSRIRTAAAQTGRLDFRPESPMETADCGGASATRLVAIALCCKFLVGGWRASRWPARYPWPRDCHLFAAIAQIRELDRLRRVAGMASRQPPSSVRRGREGVLRRRYAIKAGQEDLLRHARCHRPTTAHARWNEGLLLTASDGLGYLAHDAEVKRAAFETALASWAMQLSTLR